MYSRSARILTSVLLALGVLCGPSVGVVAATTICTSPASSTTVAFSPTLPPASWTAGVDLAPSFTVKVKCANSSIDTSWAGTITLTLDTGAFATVGSGITSKTTTNGSVSFGGSGSGLKVNTAGDYSI